MNGTVPEGKPLQSKKFVAYMISSILWKAIILTALFVFSEQLKEATMAGWWFMVTTVLVAGFVDVGYIGGQAWLDRYVRVAQITMDGRPGQIPDPKPPENDPSTPPKKDDHPAGDEEEPPAGPAQPVEEN